MYNRIMDKDSKQFVPARPGLPWATPCFQAPKIEGLAWTDIPPSAVEGRGWDGTKMPFDRLPPEAEPIAADLWDNSRSPTGMCFDFETDSTAVAVRTKLGLAQYGEPNFNATAYCGVDLYAWDDEQGRWRWAGAMHHSDATGPEMEYGLCWNMRRKARRFRMYLPMRNQLLALSLGVDEGARLSLVPPRREKPIVYYGTSIIHGAFTSRAGLGVPQMLGRRLGRPMINLGFSGCARLEPEMADILAQIDAGIFVCDPFHNSDYNRFKANIDPFFDRLCGAHPETPVFLLSAPPFHNSWLYPEIREAQGSLGRLFAEKAAEISKRHANFRFVPGEEFYDDETSIDGVHPNDVAFATMADKLEPILRAAL